MAKIIVKKGDTEGDKYSNFLDRMVYEWVWNVTNNRIDEFERSRGFEVYNISDINILLYFGDRAVPFFVVQNLVKKLTNPRYSIHPVLDPLGNPREVKTAQRENRLSVTGLAKLEAIKNGTSTTWVIELTDFEESIPLTEINWEHLV